MFNPAHPGEILRELYLNPLNLTITEAAEALGVTRKTLSLLVNQRAGVSPGMAIRLSRAFRNTTPQFWLNLQNSWDLWREKDNPELAKVTPLRTRPNVEIA